MEHAEIQNNNREKMNKRMAAYALAINEIAENKSDKLSKESGDEE